MSFRNISVRVPSRPGSSQQSPWPSQTSGTQVAPQSHRGRIHSARSGAEHLCVKPFTATPRPIETFIDKAVIGKGDTPGVHSLIHVLRECQQHYWNARWQDANGAAPWVSEHDFALIGKLVDSMLSPRNSQAFNALPPDMQGAVKNLHALRNTPGKPRYTAWTALCALLKTPPTVARRGAQALVQQPTLARQRHVAPQNVQQPRTVATPRQRPAGSSRELQQFRNLLNRLTSENVWMTEETDALDRLCHSELRKPEVWGKELSYAMWAVHDAMRRDAPYARSLMGGLLARLNQQFPQE